MNRPLSRAVWRITTWWRSRHDAPSIMGIQERISEAERAHRKRSHYYADLKRERHARLRQQLGETVTGLALAPFAIACVGFMSLADDAYAATNAPQISSNADTLIAVAGLAFAVYFATRIYSAFRYGTDDHDIFADPDKPINEKDFRQ